MISFKNITFTYSALKNPTINNVSFHIEEGEKVLIVGKSGSGKSTISKIINGLIPNSFDGELNGYAEVHNLELGKNSIFSLSKHIGTILQDQDSQFIGLTTAEDIAFFLENCNTPTSEMQEKVNEVLNTLGIQKLKSLKPQELSGGEKQRVSIAGVLVNDVKCLLLDEPLANLDPASSIEIIDLLNELNKNLGKTIIMIEHRLEDAFILNFDRVIVIDKGFIISNSTPTELLKSSILTDMGIRKPLFIEALENLDYDFSNISDIFDFSQYKLPNDFITETKIDNNQKVDNPLLEVKNLKFSYNKEREILKDINFTINKGEIVALLGNNGAGKSTLSNTILGINKCTEGEILLDSNSINNLNIFERGKLIGYVMQNPNYSITEHLVFDEVSYSLRLNNSNQKDIEKEVDSILEICGLLKYKNWPINMLSYGQKRRVTIASALIKRPKLLILDEPTAGQDYVTFKSIMSLIKTLSETLNISIIIITHNMQLAYEYCNRALVLNDGKILFNDTVNKLYKDQEVLKRSSLRETSIQTFARFHNIDSNKFGSLIKTIDNFGGMTNEYR